MTLRSTATGHTGADRQWVQARWPIPQPVAGGIEFRALSAGSDHTCGVTADGTAYCWGEGGHGALGAGALPAGCDPAAQRFCPVPVPTPVVGGHRFVHVSAGSSSLTCGVTAEGAALCWGDNSLGALGSPEVPVGCGGGTVARVPCVRHAPVAVSGGLRFAQVSAAIHACGVTTAGAAYCWGLVTDDASLGAAELGNTSYTGYFGAQRGSRAPVPVEGGLTFRAVSAGSRGSCGAGGAAG